MFRRSIVSFSVVFSLLVAGCHGLGSGDDSDTVYYVAPSLGQFTIIDASEDGTCCGPRTSELGYDDEGNVIVVMLNNWEIWANRYEVGKGWGTPVRLDQGPLSNFPVIAVADNGNALAAWVHATSSTTTFYYTSYYDRNLDSWSAPVRLNSAEGLQSRGVSISVDAAENYMLVWEQVVWTDYIPSGTVWSRKFSPLSGWGAEEMISTGSGATGQPTVRINASGQGFAVWGHQKTAADLFLLNGARYDPLTGWEAPVEFNTGTAGPAMTLAGGTRQFVVDPDGEGLFTWLQDRDTSFYTYGDDIFMNKYTNLNGWGSPELLPLNDAGHGGEESLLGIAGNGSALHVWNEGGYPNAETWYRLHDKTTGWTAPQRIAAAGGDTFISNLSVNRQGNAVAQWTAYVKGKTRIYISRYTMNGAWTAAEEIDSGTLHVTTEVRNVLDDQNMITVTFDGYAARISF